MTEEGQPPSWIREDILRTSAYPVPSVVQGTVRLDAMENPFDLPPAIHRRIARELASVPLNRYPDGEARDLKELLGTMLDLPPRNLFLGNGSDEILLYLYLASRGPVLLAEPTFSMYRILGEITGRPILSVQLSDDLTLDMTRLIETTKRDAPSIVVLSHPNNPTGLGLDAGDLERLCQSFGGGILVDEAYYPFSRKTMRPLQDRFPNLMILRTLSKLGLAGLRLGILIAAPAIIRELDKVRLPYNMDSMTQKAAMVICREFFPVLEEQASRINDLRDRFIASLGAIPGVVPVPSLANFFLLRLSSADPTRVQRLLKEQRILVRDVSHQHPLLSGCLRVTVGKKEENDLFVSTLERILKGQP